MDTTLETPPADTKTFRGRTLEEVLPQIRAELGPDAIVLRRREGLAGGVAGFFQRPYVEVEARAAHPGLEAPVPDLEARNDRATAEGLASPAIQALVEQAAPFADALARAEVGTVGERAHEVLAAAAAGDAGLYGPQPNAAAIAAAAPAPAAPAPAAPAESFLLDAPAEPEEDAEDGPPARGAAAAERRLVAAGLSAALAADVVAEAVAHGLPFGPPRGLRKLVRTALARRLPVMGDLGGGARTLAFVGAGGAGKTAAAERLAAAYARVDAAVAVVALRAPDGGAALAGRLEPLGVTVVAADDGAQAARRLKRRRFALTIVDAPAAGPADPVAVRRLADDLRALRADEVHLALPATVSAVAAEELSAALAPLGVTHVALTHADQTARAGAAVELAVTARRPLSYVSSRDELLPADPDALARQLLA